MRFSAHSDVADGAAGAGQYSPAKFSWVRRGRAQFDFHFLGTSLQKCFRILLFLFFFNMLIQFAPAWSCISCCSRVAAALSTPDMSGLYPCLFVVYWWHDKQGTISVHSKSSTTIFLILEIHSLSLSLSDTISLSPSSALFAQLLGYCICMHINFILQSRAP